MLINIKDIIEKLPEQWATEVGERGLKLSGGEKRLVSLAAVIAMEPEILLLDEPTTGLDKRGKEKVANLLSELNVPFIMISHALDFTNTVTNRIYTIKNGRIDIAAKIHTHPHIHPHASHEHLR